jgi:hypothetical protein
MRYVSLPVTPANPFKQLSTAVLAAAQTGQAVRIQPNGNVRTEGSVHPEHQYRMQRLVDQMQVAGRRK